MGDWINSLGTYPRALLVIVIAVTIKTMLANRYDRWKTNQATLPIPMVLRKGVHVPNGPVHKIERFMRIAGWAWLVWMACWLVALAYVKWYDIHF